MVEVEEEDVAVIGVAVLNNMVLLSPPTSTIHYLHHTLFKDIWLWDIPQLIILVLSSHHTSLPTSTSLFGLNLIPNSHSWLFSITIKINPCLQFKRFFLMMSLLTIATGSRPGICSSPSLKLKFYQMVNLSNNLLLVTQDLL